MLFRSIQGQFGGVHVFGEAVDNAGVGLVFAQQPHGIGDGIAGVDDKRQAAAVGGFDMQGEALVLPG